MIMMTMLMVLAKGPYPPPFNLGGLCPLHQLPSPPTPIVEKILSMQFSQRPPPPHPTDTGRDRIVHPPGPPSWALSLLLQVQTHSVRSLSISRSLPFLPFSLFLPPCLILSSPSLHPTSAIPPHHLSPPRHFSFSLLNPISPVPFFLSFFLTSFHSFLF